MLSNVQLFFSPKKPKHQTEKKLVENIAVSVLNVFVFNLLLEKILGINFGTIRKGQTSWKAISIRMKGK